MNRKGHRTPLGDARVAGPAIAACIIALTLCACAQAIKQPLSQRRVREAPWDPTVPLPAQLLPDDEVVVLGQRNLELFEPPRPLTVKDVIDDATVRAVFVGIVDLKTTAPVVMDSWVWTKMTCTIRDVLRTTDNGRFRRGQQLEFYVTGGETRVGKVSVVASDYDPPRVPRLAVHHPYLLFAQENSGLLFPTHVPLLVTNGRFTYPWPFEGPSQPRNPLERLTLHEVVAMVKNAKSSWLSEKGVPE